MNEVKAAGITRPQRALGCGRKYICDFTFFEKINTEAKAYWLGFLAADGCVLDNGTWVLMLSYLDVDHLRRLKEDIQATYPINEYFRKTVIQHKKRGPYIREQHLARLQISSRKMGEDLGKLGVTKRKTFTLVFPSKDQVPKHLMHHFIRGYFDGDGCITFTTDKRKEHLPPIWKMEIISSTQFCTKMWGTCLHNYMTGMPRFIPLPTSKGITKLTVSRLDDLISLRSFLYKDSTIFLKRKKDIFDLIQPKRDILKKIGDKICFVMAESQDEYSFPDISVLFPDESVSTIRLAFNRLINNQTIVFSRVGKNRRKFYIYEFQEQENDPFRFES